MTEEEWSSYRDPRAMLSAIPMPQRSLGLLRFACACCYRISNLIHDERLKNGLRVREEFIEGTALASELELAVQESEAARREIRAAIEPAVSEYAPEAAVGWAAGAATNAVSGNVYGASELAARAMACAADGDWKTSYHNEREIQCSVLRSVVDRPS